MKSLINSLRKHVVFYDMVLAIALVCALKLSGSVIPWYKILENDNFAIFSGLILSLSFLGYIAMVYGVDKPSLLRLRRSVQFKHIPLIMFGYLLAISLIYLITNILNDYGLFAISTAGVATFRIAYFYWKTLKLL